MICTMKLEAKVRKFDNGNGLKGFADVTIEGSFVVKGLTIRESKASELFVSMPSTKLPKPYKKEDGTEVFYQDTFFPISKESREQLIKVVLDAFGEGSPSKPAESSAPEDEFPF